MAVSKIITASWKSDTIDAIEVVRVLNQSAMTQITGHVSGVGHKKIFYIDYTINLDDQWNTTEFFIGIHTDWPRTIAYKKDRKGDWISRWDKTQPSFAGCPDIDISLTPFTNTLPIRRLKLKEGKSKDIIVLYIDLPKGKLSKAPQRYTRLEKNKYLFESLDSEFKAELEVDKNGLVKDYPGLFTRLYAK